MTKCLGFRAFAAPLAVLATISAAQVASAQPAASPDEGIRVFKSANCVGCHKWSGEGGGGYGGAAANLRATTLSLDQIEETVRCGRPTTGMPHFEADAYTDGRCYGLHKSDLPDGNMPPEPDHPLRPADIQAVAKYVVTFVKGKGNPDFAQCQAFFGAGSRVCDTYEGQPGATRQNASAPSDSPAASSHPHIKIETAADANASGK